MKKQILFTLTTAVLISTHVSLAASPPPINKPWNQYQGFYVEANTGVNIYNIKVFKSESGLKGFGWNTAFGYRFTPHFGVEGVFMYPLSSLSAAMRLTLPIGQRAAFFGKLGLMYAFGANEKNNDDNSENNNGNEGDSGNDNKSHSTSSKILPYTGLGFSYALTQNLEMSVQCQGLVLGVVNAGLLSTGLTYHF